jgi:hypothetical protein
VRCGKIESTAYSADFDRDETSQFNRLDFELENALLFSFKSEDGDSGGPVYRKRRRGRARYVGVVSGSRTSVLGGDDTSASDISVWKRNMAARPGVLAVEICRRGICRP